jgi:hypothetical protein
MSEHSVLDNIMIRPLDSANSNDHYQLNILLEEYSNSSVQNENGTYPTEKISFFVSWLKTQFKIHSRKDFMISAKFVNNELVSILIGFKLEVIWGREPNNINDTLPYWYMALAYFKTKKWNSPQKAISELSDSLVRNFEQQGYYKLYMVKKAPAVLLTLDPTIYTNKNNWLKLVPGLDRYSTTIEKIFYTQEDINNFKKFGAIGCMIPPVIKKPIMLFSLTLNTNTTFKV